MIDIYKPATIEDIQDLINWLETQGSGSYDEQDVTTCAIAQYLKARGHQHVEFTGMYVLRADGNHITLPANIGKIVYGEGTPGVGPKITTYKTALDRARKVHANMTYGIKPSEDPGAIERIIPRLLGPDGFGPAPDLPTDDD